MNLFNHRIAVLVGLGILSAGCAPESSDEETIAPPTLRPLDGSTGHGGLNGLLPADYIPRIAAIDTLFQMPLTVNGALNPDPLFTSFISSTGGAAVFKHAVGCALPVTKSAGAFVGEGFMTNTGTWLGSPLALQERSDLHTCLTARLNPYGVQVPIWIGGPDTGKDASYKDYPYFEALWSVTVPPPGPKGTPAAVFNVWPADTTLTHTHCKTTASITADYDKRICDNNPNFCAIIPRLDMAKACTGTPGGGNWLCDGKPAFETRVSLAAWNELHPTCPITAP